MCKDLRESNLPTHLVRFLTSMIWQYFKESFENPNLVWENLDLQSSLDLFALILWDYLPDMVFHLLTKFHLVWSSFEVICTFWREILGC